MKARPRLTNSRPGTFTFELSGSTFIRCGAAWWLGALWEGPAMLNGGAERKLFNEVGLA
eukprot:CAMPEP_0197668768 /NCGR_PEP_ID=MMETSP1338-20131121/70252_1 /TAXON_ID=43686 ORGANISM="Pelagodinium beii, Strain RCC1491" /NCGR_SAMPLE_ID=MMETSP1338 /ASSEMBLY_ACC=CAM_ASM_000754 /LENGTH=58 /DNA_ID=CAMNT_0043248223 /DNA_START=52 /DNA_END=224 /DNA_ORIENTATION=+